MSTVTTEAPMAAPGPTPPPDETAGERARRGLLRQARRRATTLLVAVAAAWVVLQALGSDATWAGYTLAFTEAGMVGGLADWFAVVALFRRPLRVPIPHTAIIVERKDQFGATLGDFVQTSLLTPDILVERVRSAAVVPRAAAWMAEPDHAARLARHAADAAVAAADLLRDDEVQRALEDVARRRIETTPLAPLAGRALRMVTEGGRHQEVLDVALRALDRFLAENQESLRARFATESPWWLPGAAEDRIFQRLLDGARNVLDEVARDPQHELRLDVDARLRRLTADLETSAALRARGEELKHELLAQPELREWASTVWTDLKATLRTQAADPGSELRRRLAGAIAALGVRLRDDPALAGRVGQRVESGVRGAAEQFGDEIGAMVSGTIGRWDGRETADRLELLLGPDLQYIRINGTVVGGLAGLVIHAAGQML